MSTLVQRARSRGASRSGDPLSWSTFLSYFTYGGLSYPTNVQQSLVADHEQVDQSFLGYVEGAYRSNGIIFACMLTRMMLFSQARFQFRNIAGGRPGRWFGTNALSLLEHPEPNRTTSDLLARAILDVDLAGNFYGYQVAPDRLKRVRPDWVTIVMGSKRKGKPGGVDLASTMWDLDAELLGYIYHPGGIGIGTPVDLPLERTIHFAPIPDPLANYRGMSWVTPIVRELMADNATTNHKLAFFENGATPNLVVSVDPTVGKEAFDIWKEAFEEEHGPGALDAFKTIFLGGGANVEVVGRDMQQIDLKNVQGHGETRVCMAARVPPIIVGASEGLDASTLANYGQAKRHMADGTLRPLWDNFCNSASDVVPPPPGSILAADDRDVPFLRDDTKDQAMVQAQHAIAINTLVTAGFDPESAVQAVTSGDFTLLDHTGLVSVQLLPPGTETTPTPPNGNGSAAPPAPPATTQQKALALYAPAREPKSKDSGARDEKDALLKYLDKLARAGDQRAELAIAELQR